MANFALDLTGTLLSNKVVEEEHNVSTQPSRIFIPNKGAFYGKGLVVINTANNRVLNPITQYRPLHLVTDAVVESNKEVYGVLYISDPSVRNIKIFYQAVGGIYQDISTDIELYLKEYNNGNTETDAIGQIVNAPVQVPPAHHLQHLNDFTGVSALVNVTEGIRKAVQTGDAAAFNLIRAHIDQRFEEVKTIVNNTFATINSSVNDVRAQSQRRDGRFIITDDPTNPSVYLGYGNWELIPNVLLFGAYSQSDVGEFVDIASGPGVPARKTFFWSRNDNASGITYALSSNVSTVNEGGTVKFTLTTAGLPNGSRVPYKVTGVTSADIQSGGMSGEFIINAQGVASVTYVIKNDFLTEGDEVMKLALTLYPGVSATVRINDTSKSISYGLDFFSTYERTARATNVTEGSTIYGTLFTDGVTPGTVLNLLYNDSTASTNDFSTARPTTVTITNEGVGIFQFTISEDHLTEGTETVVVNVCTSNDINTRVVSNSFDITDSSLSPTYALKFANNSGGSGSISETNEGTTAYLVVSTANVPNGTQFGLTYSSMDDGDFTNPRATTVTVNSNQAIIPYVISADTNTEGDEYLTVNLTSGANVLASRSLLVKDTSKGSTYNLYYASNSNGTNVINSASEGTVVYAVLETTSVPNGTVMGINLVGSTIDNAANTGDFTTQIPESVVVNNNKAIINIPIKADQQTEGTQVLKMNITNNGSQIASASLTINDTSVSPTIGLRFSTSMSGSNTITSIGEGATAYIIVETTNIDNGTNLAVSYSGSANAGDFVSSRANSVLIMGNSGWLGYDIKADQALEGSETLTVNVTLPDGTSASANLTINDTSVATYSARYSANANGTGTITNINEGSTAYLVMETSGVANGTEFNITYTGSTTDGNDWDSTLLTKMTVNNNIGIVPLRLKADYLTEGTEAVRAQIRLGVSEVANAYLTINDASRTPTFNLSFSPYTNGSFPISNANEGTTFYAVIKTTNIPDNTILYLAFDGSTVNAADFTSPFPSNVSSTVAVRIINNIGWYQFDVKNDEIEG